MADEQNLHNRINPNRPAHPPGQNDPLAELARLIGQNDPFSEFGRPIAPATPQAPAGPQPSGQMHMPPYPPARPQPFTSTPPSQHYHEPPAFIRPTPGSDSYPEAIHRIAGMPPSSAHYDEPYESRRGHGWRMTAAVIGLILIGTVAAFGYRFIFGGPSANSPPPIIRANPEPSKVPSPSAAVDGQGKSAYERVGDRAQGERLVSREETPVDLKDVVRPGVGRSPPQPGPADRVSPAAAAPSNAVPPSVMGEPKKVRTVTIRPNEADSSSAPPSLTPPTTAAAPAALPSPPAAPSRSTPPQFAAPGPQPPMQQQPASLPKPPVAAPGQSGTPQAEAPLSLNEPRTAAAPRQVGVQRQPPKNTEVAAAPPQALAQPPAKGGYLVQVSSQRSEADAQAALRNLQAKYPDLLGGQPATIRRVELGERGVYYRAMIGPYGNREQASQLCNSLKAAGGDCIVQGN